MQHCDRKHVYFIRNTDEGVTKIGISNDPEKRLKFLQTSNHSKLRLVGVIPHGGSLLESMLHKQLHETRLNGEWFKDSDRLRSLLWYLDNIGPSSIKRRLKEPDLLDPGRYLVSMSSAPDFSLGIKEVITFHLLIRGATTCSMDLVGRTHSETIVVKDHKCIDDDHYLIYRNQETFYRFMNAVGFVGDDCREYLEYSPSPCMYGRDFNCNDLLNNYCSNFKSCDYQDERFIVDIGIKRSKRHRRSKNYVRHVFKIDDPLSHWSPGNSFISLPGNSVFIELR